MRRRRISSRRMRKGGSEIADWRRRNSRVWVRRMRGSRRIVVLLGYLPFDEQISKQTSEDITGGIHARPRVVRHCIRGVIWEHPGLPGVAERQHAGLLSAEVVLVANIDIYPSMSAHFRRVLRYSAWPKTSSSESGN